jgi:uncharacterized protein YecE (DUF72 family)
MNYVGTSGFSYPKWKGTFYPAKTAAKDMLGYYSGRFRAVEINNTFYKPPEAAGLAAWGAQVPAGFRFAFKAPQRITHILRLRNADAEVAALFAALDTLGEKLGPVLFGLPPNFKKDADRLRVFLGLLPAGRRVAFEFRHASWFDDEVFALLRASGIALCIADETDDLVVPVVATTDWGYLRLRRPEYDEAALKLWAERMAAQKWKDCFVFFKHEDTGTGPEFATQLLKTLEVK